MRKQVANLDHGIWRVRIAANCGFGKSGKKLKGPVKAVLVCLALHILYSPSKLKPGKTNDKTKIGVLTIAEKTGFSKDTVSRALETLNKEGLISRHVRDGSRRKTRITSLNWDAIQAGQIVTTYAAQNAEREPEYGGFEEDESAALDLHALDAVTQAHTLDDLLPTKHAPIVNQYGAKISPPKKVATPTSLIGPADKYLDAAIELLRQSFPDHVNFSSDQQLRYFRQNLQQSVEYLESSERLYELCSFVVADQTPRGLRTIKKIAESESLANYFLGAIKKDLLSRFSKSKESIHSSPAQQAEVSTQSSVCVAEDDEPGNSYSSSYCRPEPRDEL